MLEEIKDIFSIFHDGGIVAANRDGDQVTFKIDIQYLASLIDLAFRHFNLVLENVGEIYFETWAEDGRVIKDWDTIFALGLDIYGARIGPEGRVLVSCYCYRAMNPEFSGGELVFKGVGGYALTDEIGRPVTIDELKAVSTQYWDAFGKRKSKRAR